MNSIMKTIAVYAIAICLYPIVLVKGDRLAYQFGFTGCLQAAAELFESDTND